jgi:hypothetical protein
LEHPRPLLANGVNKFQQHVHFLFISRVYLAGSFQCALISIWIFQDSPFLINFDLFSDFKTRASKRLQVAKTAIKQFWLRSLQLVEMAWIGNGHTNSGLINQLQSKYPCFGA